MSVVLKTIVLMILANKADLILTMRSPPSDYLWRNRDAYILCCFQQSSFENACMKNIYFGCTCVSFWFPWVVWRYRELNTKFVNSENNLRLFASSNYYLFLLREFLESTMKVHKKWKFSSKVDSLICHLMIYSRWYYRDLTRAILLTIIVSNLRSRTKLYQHPCGKRLKVSVGECESDEYRCQ